MIDGGSPLGREKSLHPDDGEPHHEGGERCRYQVPRGGRLARVGVSRWMVGVGVAGGIVSACTSISRVVIVPSVPRPAPS